MKKILLLIVIIGSSLNAYTIKFINQTGAPLTGTVRYAGCKGKLSASIPDNGTVETDKCCFVGASLTAGGKSGMVWGERNSGLCKDVTYEVTNAGNQLAIRKQ